MKTVRAIDPFEQSRGPLAPIVDIRAMVRAEVVQRVRQSTQFDRVVTKVMARVERELDDMEAAL